MKFNAQYKIIITKQIIEIIRNPLKTQSEISGITIHFIITPFYKSAGTHKQYLLFNKVIYAMLPNLKCASGHDVFSFCASQQCEFPSVTCDSQDCTQCKKHSDCYSMYIAKNLIKKIAEKGEERKKVDDIIIEMYDEMIKMLAKEKKDFIKWSKQFFGLSLRKEERTLYGLIESLNGKEITQQLIKKVEKSLFEESIDFTIKKIKLQIPTLLQKVERIVDQAKLNWSEEVPEDKILFSELYYDQESFEISDNMKSVKRKDIHPSKIKFVLMEQTIQKFTKPMKYEFKIHNAPMFYGIAHKQTIINNEFIPTSVSSNDGTYFMGVGGKTYNCEYGEEVKNTNFSAKTGDVVVLEVNLQTQVMAFYKRDIEGVKKEKERFEMHFAIKAGNPLHLCIAMSKQDAEVEFLGARPA